jgi:hypothetical protein
VGLKISYKISQKNLRFSHLLQYPSLKATFFISQSNDLHLSKQRSLSLKAKVSLSLLFSSITIFLNISFSLCFLDFFFFSHFFFFFVFRSLSVFLHSFSILFGSLVSLSFFFFLKSHKFFSLSISFFVL